MRGETRQAPRPAPPRDTTPPALRARIDELLHDGYHDASVAELLNAEGWRRRSGAPDNSATVRSARKRSGLKTLCERQREAGKLTVAKTAVLWGIGLKTVGNWVRAGRLRGRLSGKGRAALLLCDPIDEQPEPMRQRVAERATMRRHRGVLSDAAVGQGAV